MVVYLEDDMGVLHTFYNPASWVTSYFSGFDHSHRWASPYFQAAI